jgi:hypothetical protein
MELSDSATIRALLDYRDQHPPHRKKKTTADVQVAYVGRPKHRCRCGQCSSCVEAAKWERIFQEKFADPDYYQQRPTLLGSSLGWLP